jgi:hypothetical protein
MTFAPTAPSLNSRRAAALAEQRLGRPLTAAEHNFDIAAAHTALEDGKQKLAEAIEAEKRRAIQRWVRGGKVKLTVTPAMEKVLRQLHDAGAKAATAELRRRGVELQVEGYAAATTRLKRIIKQLGKLLPSLALRVRRGAVQADVQDAGAAAVARQLAKVPGALDIASRMVSSGWNAGRASVFETHQELVPKWQYSAVLDARTCDICEHNDGTEFDTLDALYELLPNFGPCPDCLGDGRCRCTGLPLF